MSSAMTASEIHSFMLAGRRTGKLATVRADGSPHVVPVWFTFDEAGRIVFLTGASTVKARNMHREPRVSMAVDEQEMPFSWARVDGTVTFSEDPGELLLWATESCRRYVGDDQAAAFGRRNAVPGELVVFLTPIRMVGERNVAAW
jgi:PPOX class probable F420-dependent enzyme